MNESRSIASKSWRRKGRTSRPFIGLVWPSTTLETMTKHSTTWKKQGPDSQQVRQRLMFFFTVRPFGQLLRPSHCSGQLSWCRARQAQKWKIMGQMGAKTSDKESKVYVFAWGLGSRELFSSNKYCILCLFQPKTQLNKYILNSLYVSRFVLDTRHADKKT